MDIEFWLAVLMCSMLPTLIQIPLGKGDLDNYSKSGSICVKVSFHPTSNSTTPYPTPIFFHFQTCFKTPPVLYWWTFQLTHQRTLPSKINYLSSLWEDPSMGMWGNGGRIEAKTEFRINAYVRLEKVWLGRG